MLSQLGRRGAIAALLLAAVLALWALTAPPPPSRVGTMKITDTALYAEVIRRVDAGDGYYPAVTTLQRDNGAPVRPFVAVRLPTLAMIEAALGPAGTRAAALALLAANALAFLLLLRRSGFALPEQVMAAALVAGAGALVFMPPLLVWHEIWAGLLLGLALAAMAAGRWQAALVPAALAVAIRELALPFVLLALALAVLGRRRRESFAWAAVLLAFGLALAAHRLMVEAQLRPGDLASPGWLGLRGPVAVVDSLHDLTLLGGLPRPLAYLSGLAPLLGWLALPPARARFPVLFFTGYFVMLSLFARPDNYYWASLVLPAWFAGLALAPRGLAILVNRAMGHAPACPARPLT